MPDIDRLEPEAVPAARRCYVKNADAVGGSCRVNESLSLLFPALGLPISIRGIAFRNRIVQAPMCAMYANADGSATRQNIEYYRARAAGGAAAIIVEITFTDDAGSRASSEIFTPMICCRSSWLQNQC
jgi:NADH:flavin oxidoreductase / NADH oxidase family